MPCGSAKRDGTRQEPLQRKPVTIGRGGATCPWRAEGYPHRVHAGDLGAAICANALTTSGSRGSDSEVGWIRYGRIRGPTKGSIVIRVVERGTREVRLARALARVRRPHRPFRRRMQLLQRYDSV